jgi:hypothetical protein
MSVDAERFIMVGEIEWAPLSLVVEHEEICIKHIVMKEFDENIFF